MIPPYLLSLAIAAQAVSPQTTPPPALQPTSKWNVEYADNACKVARAFGADRQRVVVALELLPGRTFSLMALEDPWEGKAKPRSGYLVITAQPGDKKMRGTVSSGSVRAGSRVTYFSIDEDALDAMESADTVAFNFLDQRITIAPKNLKAALAVAENCENDLLRSWKIDPEQYRRVAVRAKSITSPTAWVRVDDYPPESLRQKEAGRVTVRIDVDATGRVENCAILTSSGFPRLDQATCSGVRQRARYWPARLADGTPTPWRSILRFRWQP